MNKTEKIICLLLGAVLAWYIWAEMGRAKERAKYAAEQAAIAATNVTAEAAAPQPSASEDELRTHLGELLEERVVVLEGGFAPDGVRDVVRGKSAAHLSHTVRPTA